MITNNYYSVALDDYKLLKLAVNEKLYNQSAVLSQQVVEKLLKFIVDTFCVGHKEAKVALNKHNLRKLYSIVVDEDIQIELNKKDLTFIEDFYFDARYPGDDFRNVSESDAKECLEIAEDVKSKVEALLLKNMYCTDCGTKLLSTGACPNVNCIKD